MTTIGIIGSGNIGSNVARAAVNAGYDVVISNSRGPATLTELVAELGPRARAAHTSEAAAAGDLVLVAIPLKAIGHLNPSDFAGKVVIDANNYYPERDGRIAVLDANEATTSELLKHHLPQAHVVKAFNHIFAKDIPTDGTPAGTQGRRALVIGGNERDPKAAVTDFLNDLGYDAVDVGPLSETWRIERDTPGYGPKLTKAEYEALLPSVERIQQV